MKGIIITGHGNFATGLASTLKLVIGEQEKTFFIDFTEELSSGELNKKIENAILELNNNEGILIFTDILGGTPFNESAMLATKYSNITVFGGTNMAMLFEAFDIREKEEYGSILEEGKNGMGIFTNNLVDIKDSDEDGI